MGNRFKVAGRVYDIPEDMSDAFISDMESRGQSVGPADDDPADAPARAVEARMEVGQPTVIRTPKSEPDAYEGLAPQAEQDHFMRTLEDPAYFGKQLVGAAGRYIGGAIGGGGAGGLVSGAASGALGSAVGEGASSVAREDSAIDGLVNAARAAVGGGVLGGLFGGIGSASKAGADAARSGADSARLAAGGVKGPQLAAYADQNGLKIGDAKRAMVDAAERIVPPNAAVPRSTAGIEGQYRDAARGLNSELESQIASAQQGGAQLPQDVRGRVAGNLYQQSDAAKRSGFAAAEADPRSAVARNVELGPQSTTPQEVRAQKIGFDANAYSGAPGTPESMQGIANKAAGDQYRGILGDYMGQAGPEAQGAFEGASRDYGVAATWRDAAAAKAAQQATSFSAGTQGGGLVDRALSMVPGGSYVPDAAANGLAAASQGLEGIGTTANWMARAAPEGAERAISALSSASKQARGEQPDDSNQPVFKDSRGDMLGEQIQRVVSTPEGRVAMRPYRDEFLKARTSDEATVVFQRLMATDPEFARTIPRLLQGNR